MQQSVQSSAPRSITAGENASSRPAPAGSDSDPASILNEHLGIEEQLYETTPTAKNYNRINYGLLGILKVIRMTDTDLNTLALGTDLTSLGLNLNSADCIYPTFSSVWSETPGRQDEFSLPDCYLEHSCQIKASHLKKIQQETLFYVFYNMPRDVLQCYAAGELYERRWAYHAEYKKWFFWHKGPPSRWDYFEPATWKIQPFEGDVDIGMLLKQDSSRLYSSIVQK